MSDRGPHLDLAACQEALERLAGEVTLLREASTAFADLAERLNGQLLILRGQLGPADSVQPSLKLEPGPDTSGARPRG
jgi:hypothetical protein